MAYAPKNDGRPNVKFYESADILSLFEGVKSWLMKNAKKVKVLFSCFCILGPRCVRQFCRRKSSATVQCFNASGLIIHYLIESHFT